MGLHISGHATKTKGDVEQGNRVIGAHLGRIAMWMIQFNLMVVEAEERSLLGWMWFAEPYNMRLSIQALSNAGKYFTDSKAKKRRFLDFAMKFGAQTAASTTLGMLPSKSNGAFRYSSPIFRVPGSTTAFVLTGDHFLDRSAAQALTGLTFVPGWLAEWHHHEVMGILMLVYTPAHRIPHIGGKEFYNITHGLEKYPNSWSRGTPPA